MIFIKQCDKQGNDCLGTTGFIRLDARQSRSHLITLADYHMAARNWAGYNMYQTHRLHDKWTRIHQALNPLRSQP